MQQDPVRASLTARRREVLVRYFEYLQWAAAELERSDPTRVLTALDHADADELVDLTAAIQRHDENH